MRPSADDVRAFSQSLDPAFAENVSRWDVRVGEDHWGDPAIFVTAVLKDSHAHRAWGTLRGFEQRLFRALLERHPEYFPFVLFSAESEALDPLVPVKA
ncbi:MAG: hypothetical protein ACKVVT_01320 [Dehalococcoidia bacterium]